MNEMAKAYLLLMFLHIIIRALVFEECPYLYVLNFLTAKYGVLSLNRTHPHKIAELISSVVILVALSVVGTVAAVGLLFVYFSFASSLIFSLFPVQIIRAVFVGKLKICQI